MRLLVVEDETKMAVLLRRGLEREGYAVDVATDGPEAIWAAEEVAFDAVVLDVMIPEPDGFEVCRRLREQGIWSPVLLLTARDSVEDRVRGLDAGADDYLTKPFAFAELFARLRALTRRGITHLIEHLALHPQDPRAIDFNGLPWKDAFTIVRGDGKRKLAVFEDPNCGYCKRFEADLQKVNNVTVHMFLLPILGKDSMEKSKNIWCAKDRAKAWTDWMLRDIMPPAATCDTSALTRNVELSKKFKITGTPTLVFADGSRVPGAISAAQLEKLLADAKP